MAAKIRNKLIYTNSCINHITQVSQAQLSQGTKGYENKRIKEQGDEKMKRQGKMLACHKTKSYNLYFYFTPYKLVN